MMVVRVVAMVTRAAAKAAHIMVAAKAVLIMEAAVDTDKTAKTKGMHKF